MLSALAVLAAVVVLLRARARAVITPGFDAAGAAPDHRADPDHAARAAVPRRRARSRRASSTRAAGSGPRRSRRSSTTSRSSAAPCSWRPALGVAGLAIGVVIGRGRPPAGPGPGARARLGVRLRPARRPARPGRRGTALLLMAPRALGLGATQIMFLVMTSLASTLGDGRDRRLQLRVRDPPDPDRRHRRAAGRRAAAVAVARGRDRRHGRRSAGCSCAALSMLAYVMLAHRGARDRRCRRTSSSCCSASRASGQAALDATADDRSPSSSSASPRTR